MVVTPASQVVYNISNRKKGAAAAAVVQCVQWWMCPFLLRFDNKIKSTRRKYQDTVNENPFHLLSAAGIKVPFWVPGMDFSLILSGLVPPSSSLPDELMTTTI